MTTERESFYKAIHKAIRAALSQLAGEAGRTDFADPAALARLRELLAGTFAMLDDHAHHEDLHVMPMVQACAPEVAARLSAAHRELDQMAGSLWRMFGVVSQAGSRAAYEGHALLLQLSRYHAAQLSHLADEEELAQPALWRAYGDETLRRAYDAVVASIPPEKMTAAMTLMLPALNARERAAILSGVKAAAPAPAFEALLGVAAGALDAEAFARLQRDLSAARAA